MCCFIPFIWSRTNLTCLQLDLSMLICNARDVSLLPPTMLLKTLVFSTALFTHNTLCGTSNCNLKCELSIKFSPPVVPFWNYIAMQMATCCEPQFISENRISPTRFNWLWTKCHIHRNTYKKITQIHQRA